MSGKRLRVYVDTSVIGGCGDDEFKGPSTRLMQRFISGQAILVVSDVMIAELVGAPDQVQAVLRDVAPANSVNLREGYALLEIRSPQEVLQDEPEGQGI